MSQNAVIIGAGISGLTVAFYLKRAGFDVTVLEADPDVGGTMKSKLVNGYLIESGPTSALETTPLLREIATEVGLSSEMIYSSDAAKNRYILRDGRLHALPMSPPAFFRSRLWSLGGKLRVLAEPFHGRATEEESIAQFVRRRLGQEFLDYAINPFVAGVYAGDPERLSVRAALPKLYALEEKYGGLVLGMIRGAKERRHRAEQAKVSAKMFSFHRGMGTLPEAIAAALGDAIITNARATRLITARESFRVEVERDGQSQLLDAQTLVLATPAYRASALVGALSTETAQHLDGIYYPPVTEVVFGYKVKSVGTDLNGFGFLVPEKERRRILGTIWSSTIFPGRAPEGHVELTTFVGGTRQPEIALLADEELIKVVSEELKAIMRTEGEPDFVHLSRWERAIPQYNLGHLKTIAALEQFERAYPGIHFCANYRGGIAVGDCIMSGHKTAEMILKKEGSRHAVD
jgi:oxygen-dependent protoporphyrinogen oxidase